MNRDDDKRVAEWYDTISRSYDELHGKEQALKHRAVLEFLEKEKIDTLVDIGCGTGRFLLDNQQLYDYAVGIDLSINMLKAAKKVKSDKIDLVVATCDALPVKTDTADSVVSISVAKGEPRLREFLAELARIGRKDSIVALTVFRQSDAWVPNLEPDLRQLSRISDRETLYFFSVNK